MKNEIMVAGLLAAMLTGCAGFGGRGDAPRARLLERIPSDRPSWVGWEDATREKNGQVFFVAAALQGGDYALTVAQAETEAAALLARRVGEDLSHRLRSNVMGPNRVSEEAGRYIQRTVEEQTRTFKMSGVDVRGRYCERLWETAPTGSRQYYNCWVQLSVPKADLVAARRQMAQQAAAAAGNHQDDAARMAAEAFTAELGASGARE